jgi:6-phosphogluconolactonase
VGGNLHSQERLVSTHAYIYEDAQATAAHCAATMLELLGETLGTAPRATLAISGGTTPKLMFGELVKASFDWEKVHLFWVDERGVPPDDPQSNYKLAKDCFLDPAGFPSRNLHRIQAELQPELAARSYAQEIREFFGLAAGDLPHFDLIHRGMGPDAHTASLFPGEAAIGDLANLVAAVYVEKFHQWRITLLPGVLLAAKQTIMLVAGADKAEPLRSVLHGPYDPKQYPAQIATYDSRNVMWFLDRAAAKGMD